MSGAVNARYWRYRRVIRRPEGDFLVRATLTPHPAYQVSIWKGKRKGRREAKGQYCEELGSLPPGVIAQVIAEALVKGLSPRTGRLLAPSAQSQRQS